MSPLALAIEMAFVPQQEPASFDFTVREVVLMGRYPHLGRRRSCGEADYALAAEALQAADIVHLADRPITRLSGGEHRRVLLARALAQDTPVLLLDEPTAHLDVTHQAELLALVRKLAHRQGKAVLAALHELNDAAQYCDRLALMRDGSIIDQGTPEQVITPKNLERAYGASARVGRNPVTGRPMILALHSLREAEGSTSAARVHLICGGGSGVSILHALIRAGYSVTSGVLNESDSDYETASALGVEIAAERPFSAITPQSRQVAEALMADADYVLVAAVPFGTGNLANLELAESAQSRGARVVLLGAEDISTRDYTGGLAITAFQHMLAQGARSYSTVEAWLATLDHQSPNSAAEPGESNAKVGNLL
jgi:iron complex transport system ATP-binding protein